MSVTTNEARDSFVTVLAPGTLSFHVDSSHPVGALFLSLLPGEQQSMMRVALSDALAAANRGASWCVVSVVHD